MKYSFSGCPVFFQKVFIKIYLLSGKMKNLLKLCLWAIPINVCFSITAIASSGSQYKESTNSGLYLEGVYDLYVEPLFQSPFVFLLPKDEYKVFRTSSKNSRSSLETCLDKGNVDIRYKMHTGFLLHREDDSHTNTDTESKYVIKQIEKFLNTQMTDHKVFFYDQKYDFANEFSAVCEGNIFSPALNAKGATGIYFLKRYMPIYNGQHYTFQACYLLFYSFELDYESAKAEFEKISGYVHCVYDGCVR